MKRQLAIMAGGALLMGLLAGCSEDEWGPQWSGGSAVAQNKAAHIINPEPAPIEVIDLNGKRGALAIRRYEQGRVKSPSSEGVE